MADSYGKTNLPPGFALQDGGALNALLTKVLQGGLSRQDTITAKAGGTKAAATVLNSSLNRISVCATNGDSVLLPKAIAGSILVIVNSGAATLSCYGKGTDTIDGAATATASDIATTKARVLVCLTTGAWFTISLVA